MTLTNNIPIKSEEKLKESLKENFCEHELNKKLLNYFGDKVLNDVSLAPFTSWRIGGKAKRLFKPDSIDCLVKFLKLIPEDEKLFWLGLGSNVLVKDTGFLGTVILTLKGLGDIRLITDKISTKSNQVRVEAGVTLAKIAKFCAKNSLFGGEFFAGIPGTMGGALAMNAGAFGSETWDLVKELEVVTKNGELKVRKPEEYKIGYRSVSMPNDEYFVAATLEFETSTTILSQNKIKSLLKERNEKQPIGVLSCGSVFTNPKPLFAAKLIEDSGLKGFKIGGAKVSTKHANFIINYDNAKASDVEELIFYVRSKVFNDHGVLLSPEVKIIGDI